MQQQRYRADVRLVQVVTLLGVVSVTASSEEAALAQASELAQANKIVITQTEETRVIGYEVLTLKPQPNGHGSGWDGTERRT